jgi:predicted DNA-binding WGR domain protein
MDPICLKRHNPARRMHRYYCLTVAPNLFGEWSLIRTWGRIGKPSQTKIDLHATEQAAQAAMERKERQKRRRGYA